MKPILVTQRVDPQSDRKERWDSLDQSWAVFLAECGLFPIPVANHPSSLHQLLETVPHHGVLLTGGNDLAVLGGDAAERDQVESILLQHARLNRLPILGVCRGMQVIQNAFGVKLAPISHHVHCNHEIQWHQKRRLVNSFHRYGTFNSDDSLKVIAFSSDGVVEAVQHCSESIVGIMWHPEREKVFACEDILLFRKIFGVTKR